MVIQCNGEGGRGMSCADAASGGRAGGPENSKCKGSEARCLANRVGTPERRLEGLQGQVASANREDLSSYSEWDEKSRRVLSLSIGGLQAFS